MKRSRVPIAWKPSVIVRAESVEVSDGARFA
jgi:hypothetical protein